jgi:hypothetical protein
MNKTFVIISITLHALYYHPSAASMTMNKLFEQKDVVQELINRIPREDFPDMRLVCKKWAQRGVDGIIKKNWQFMPDSVEKHYDHIIKQNKEFKSVHKMMILFDLVNNDDAVVWMVNRNTNKGIQLNYFSTPCVVTAAMLAIHYEQPETARLLIETNEKHYANQNWKDLYHKTLTIPQQIEECLSPGHNRDFSFIPYLTAAWFDNEHNLKKLYEHKIPTILGQSLIIDTCLRDNAIQCFTYLASHKKTKEAIRKKVTVFFMLAIDENNPKLAKIFLKKKLFNINRYYEKKHNEKTVLTTLLDFYLQNKKYENNEQAHALLRSLGAKTYQEIQDGIRERNERAMRRRQKGWY